MSTPRNRLDRLEAAIPPSREPYPYDLDRLTIAQKERMAEIQERADEVGLTGLTDAEVDEAAMVAEILLAPEWPVPEKPTTTRWRTEWQRT